MYNQYRERKAEDDAKYRAKKAREEHGDDEWEGLSVSERSDISESSDLDEDDDSSEDDEASPVGGLLTDLDNSAPNKDGLSKRAAAFFSQDLFQGITEVLPTPEVNETNGHADRNKEHAVGEAHSKSKEREDRKTVRTNGLVASDLNVEKDDQEGQSESAQAPLEDDWEQPEARRPDGKLGESPVHITSYDECLPSLDIDIITAEAMTLAHQLATGQKTSHDAVDDGFNKLAFRDRDGLPDWFLDDEGRHDKLQKPISKAAALAIKEKTRAFNARPIKKVREAQARKKFKAAQRMEKLKKKSDMLANDEGMTEKEKADSISKLMSKAGRKKPTRQPAKLVVAKGANRGIQGRPKGVKGRYRIVDARMKKELRAQKRIAQRKKK
jgi:AdoMet-dependent rRNA methyltransferase SPB1